MTPIKFFFKYCGGCKPHFNRKKYGQELLERTGGVKVHSIAEADYVLLLNGCQCQCVAGEGQVLSPIHNGQVLTVEELIAQIKSR